MTHTNISNPGATEARAENAAAPQQPVTRRRSQPPAFNHAHGSPRERQAVIRVDVLRVVNRFRQVRAIDIAAALFPHRPFKAALSAAQRSLGRLVHARFMTRYRSLSGQTYYGLATRGAQHLREHGKENNDADASASASRAVEKTNPEHALWSAFAVLCSEARGFTAFTERELAPRYASTPGSLRRYPLAYRTADGHLKGLMPDAVALRPDGALVWFEIDRSGRGSARLNDLVGLVSRIGSHVDLGNGKRAPLRTVVVWCKTRSILRRNRTHLTGEVMLKNGSVPRLRVGPFDEAALQPLGNERYSLRREFEVALASGHTQVQTQLAGEVHLQLLPTHLPGYSYRDGPPAGWFNDGSLPYRVEPGQWPATQGQMDR